MIAVRMKAIQPTNLSLMGKSLAVARQEVVVGRNDRATVAPARR
jgi:hypothetical protein